MAAAAEPRIIARVGDDEEEQQRVVDLVGCDGVVAREANKRRESRMGMGVEGGLQAEDGDKAGRGRGHGGGRTTTTVVPPPHAWLAIEDTAARKNYGDSDPEEEQWARLLRGGGGPGPGKQQQRRRSSFGVVWRERAAREAWLDRAWEMKRSWHERNGGAPDADTPVVVVVGKAPASPLSSSSSCSHAGAVGGGGGVAMDVEEVRACRDLGLELPADCTVEIQCFGLSGSSSPTHTASSAGSSDSPCSISTHGADPVDVKARLKVWAQAVALASTTHLGS